MLPRRNIMSPFGMLSETEKDTSDMIMEGRHGQTTRNSRYAYKLDSIETYPDEVDFFSPVSEKNGKPRAL